MNKKKVQIVLIFIPYFIVVGLIYPVFTHENDKNSKAPKYLSDNNSYHQDTNKEKKETNGRIRNIGAFPIIFYTDETRFAGGAGLYVIYQGKSKRHSSSIGLLGFYTQNKQYTFVLEPEYYYKGDRYKITGEIAFIYFPNKFYGIGNNTKKENEEEYSTRVFRLNPILQKKIFSNFYAGIQYDLIHSKLTKIEEGKVLDSGKIFGSDGGRASGLGIKATWDTRNNNLYPTSGQYFQFSSIAYETTLGSNYTFSLYRLDLRQYKLLFGNHILAVQGIVGISNGNPPFQMLYELGSNLRGYYQNRFQDKNLVAFQAEYRLPVYGRFGLVGFAGMGEVTHQFKNISMKEMKPSAGFGIRFTLIPEQKINLRIDFGYGKDDSSFDIIINEMF
jgi:hypothetical protein